jgi:hypothetical protein
MGCGVRDPPNANFFLKKLIASHQKRRLQVSASIFLRKTHILANKKDMGQRTRDGGTEDRNSGIEPQKRDTGAVARC